MKTSCSIEDDDDELSCGEGGGDGDGDGSGEGAGDSSLSSGSLSSYAPSSSSSLVSAWRASSDTSSSLTFISTEPTSSSDSSTSSARGMMTDLLKRRKPTARRFGARLWRPDLRTGCSGDTGARDRAEWREGAEEDEEEDILLLYGWTRRCRVTTGSHRGLGGGGSVLREALKDGTI